MQSSHWEKLTLLQSKKDQISEFGKKYRGTFLWLEVPEKAKRLVEFSDMENDFFILYDPDTDIHYRITYESEAILYALFPEPGLINTKHGMKFFTRIPARQYRKAPCVDNCVAVDPLHNTFVNKGGRLQGVTYSDLLAAYAPHFFTWEEASSNLTERNGFSYAVSKDFGLSTHHQSDDSFLLWYKMWPIGSVTKNHIKLMVPSLKQEVSDFLVRNKLEVSVE